MRRWRWFLAMVAAVACFALSARAQEAASAFKPVEFVVDPDAERASVYRLALTSETQGEITAVRGARPVKGTWKLVAGRFIRFLVPDGTVQLFCVLEDDLINSLRTGYSPRQESAWFAAVARDRMRREPPRMSEIRSAGGRPCALIRWTDTEADWFDARNNVVAVTLTAKDATTWVARFPDGSDRTLVKQGSDWEDTTRDAPAPRSESQVRDACLEHLTQLARAFVAERSEKPGKPGKPRYDGTALFLSWRKSRSYIKAGEEAVLQCPGDPALLPLAGPAARERYDLVDLGDPTPGLCSYAVRDFSAHPLTTDAPKLQAIACCRQGADGKTPHHKGGICIAFEDGTALFWTAEELGLAPDEPIVVGPDSKAELLRTMVYIKKR